MSKLYLITLIPTVVVLVMVLTSAITNLLSQPSDIAVLVGVISISALLAIAIKVIKHFTKDKSQ